MLVDRVLHDLDLPDADERGGNPIRGSRLGRCARQSAYMLFPDAYPPEPLPARSKLVFAFGDMIHEMVRKQFRRVCKGEWGMEEERFHFRVPLTVKEAEAAWTLIQTGSLTGYVQMGDTLVFYHRGFRPLPKETSEHKRGLWLNMAEPALYVPLHVDGIADAGPFGLAPVEIKSMTTAGFRYALAGKIDYSYRVQMAVAVDGTATDTAVYVAVRKDTSHILEVLYSKKVDTVAVTFTKQGQMIRALEQAVERDDATAMDDWEAAEVQHPFEPELLDDARERVKKILLATPVRLPAREHGPTFECATCEGTGTQTKAKNTGLPLVKGAKPCVDCERTEGPMGTTVPSGQRSETELPWQCRYCAFLPHCWGEVQPQLRFDKEAKPHFWITRAAYLASGIEHEGRR